MKKIFMISIYPLVTAILTALLTFSTMTICVWIGHQPVMEDGIEDFKKCK